MEQVYCVGVWGCLQGSKDWGPGFEQLKRQTGWGQRPGEHLLMFSPFEDEEGEGGETAGHLMNSIGVGSDTGWDQKLRPVCGRMTN